MHLLGLANGSLGGNSEFLLKAALSAAVEKDPSITVSWLHVPSVIVPPNPKPLTGGVDVSLGQVASMQAGSNENSLGIPDDRAAVLEAILEADAIIVSTPTWSHQPPGILKAVFDRIMGPYTDSALAKMVIDGKAVNDPMFAQTPAPDARILKPRVAGFMAVAGSTLPDQITQSLTSLHCLLYPLHVKVVDQHVFAGFGNPGSVLVSEKNNAILRAEKLGEHVASQMGKEFDDAVFLGHHAEGACPQCHLIKFELLPENGVNQIGCIGCGGLGQLVVRDNGVIMPEWEDDSEASCITMKGKVKHVHDIFEGGKAELARMHEMAEELEAKQAKWKEVKFPSVQLPSYSEES
ncbi:hypothetical protein G7054_g9347 [Neopestalotiopsis clavispora]|nr:hypothetical protein G7054_g9347 [Neopestalotiopsis clavispora]